MRQRKKIAGAIAGIIIALFAGGYDYILSDFFPQKPQVEQTVAPKIDPLRVWSRGRGKTALENAAYHFKKHGAEFGYETEEEYIAAAVAFTTNPPKEVMQNKQRDGDTAFYNPETAEYAVKSRRGFIRTYFILDAKIHGYPSNLDYFNAQEARTTKVPANDNRAR